MHGVKLTDMGARLILPLLFYLLIGLDLQLADARPKVSDSLPEDNGIDSKEEEVSKPIEIFKPQYDASEKQQKWNSVPVSSSSSSKLHEVPHDVLSSHDNGHTVSGDVDIPDSSFPEKVGLSDSLPGAAQMPLPGDVDFMDSYEDEILPTEAPKEPPKYMMELYQRFNNDRYSHPMANIVRSFTGINQDSESQQMLNLENRTRTHTLMFNFTSVSRDEEIYIAELRLFTLVEKDRNQYIGVDRKVSVYQIQPGLSSDDEESSGGGEFEPLACKQIYGRYSGWETFTITDAVKRWVKLRTTVQVLQVRIETVFPDSKDSSTTGNMDIDMTNVHRNEPILVVFSNDRKKKKSETRELHEILAHEMDLNAVEENLDYDDGDYIDYPEDMYNDRDTGYRKKKKVPTATLR